MSKFVGGLITGSVLTLVGIGIAAVISDNSSSKPFNAWDIISVDGDDDDDSEENSEDSEEDNSPDTEEADDSDEKTDKSSAYGILGSGIAALFNAAAAGIESFEKTLSEENGNSDESEEDEE